MNVPDPSMVSKSTSSASNANGANSDLMIKAQANIYFNLYDQMTSLISLPTILYQLFLVFIAIQLLFTSIWHAHSNLFVGSQFYDIFKSISCFTGPNYFEVGFIDERTIQKYLNDTRNEAVEEEGEEMGISLLSYYQPMNLHAHHNKSIKNHLKNVNHRLANGNRNHHKNMNSTSLNLTDDFLGPNKKSNILEDGADDEQSGLNDYITTEILKSGKNDVNYISSFVAYSLVFLIFILINVFQLLEFLKIRRFFKKSLYPTRFVNELVPAVMILPLANFTSEMFYFISSSKTSKVLYVVFFVVGLIELIFFSVAFYLSNSLFGISPFISSSPINSMYGEFYVRLVCFTPYFALINGILKKFNGWILHPFILLHLAFNIYMLIRIMYRPFLKLGTNVFFMAIICACILNDAMRLVGLFFPQPNQLITMIAFFAFIVLGFIVSGIFYFVQTRSIKKMISVFEDQDSFMNDSDKRQLFKDLALDKNNQRAIMILSYVWVNQFVPLLDNSLFHFIAITFHDIWTVTHIIKFISFLPANSNILNVMMNEAFKRRDLKLKHVFFLFQVQKIKMLRQSSTSTAAVERLKTLKQSTKELELKIKNFFTRSDSNLMLLYNLSKEIKKEKTFWEEVIRSYPNSIPHIDENAHFLIECATDFIEAIKQKHKSNLIESGKNYNVDQCFRRFVRVYPGFLKKGIVDMKGNFIKISRAKGNGSLSSMSSHSNNVMSSASSSSVSQIDLQVEESIGRLMIKQARIRLALQRATESRKADIYKAFIIDVLAMFAISFASFIFLYVFFDNYYDSRGDNTKRIEYANKVRLNLFATALSNLYFWGNDTKSINTSEFQPIYDDYDDPNVYFFPPDSEMDWEWKAVKFSLDARLIFRELLLDVSDMSINAIDVYKYSNSLFEETTPVKYCDSAIPLSIPLRANLKTIVPFLLMEFTMFSTYPSKEWWKNASDICNAFASMAVSWKGFEDLRTTLTEYGTDQMKQTQSLLYMLRILFPSIYGVVTIIPFCIIVYLFSREINMFADLIMKLPSSIKQEAYHPLRKDSDDVISTQDDQGESLSSFSLPFLLTIIISLLFLINAILIFVQVTMLNQTNLNYNYLLQWTADARIRKCNIIELIYWIYNLIFLDNPLVQGTKIINSTTMSKLANYEFTQIDDATTSLMTDTPGNPSSIGIDDDIDRLTLKEDCIAAENSSLLHDQYRCSSAQHMINTILSFASQMMLNISVYGGRIDQNVPVEIFHIASNHLIPKLIQIDDRYNALADKYKSDYEGDQIVFIICQLFIVVATFGLISSLNKILCNSYSMILTLLRRVSPVAIVNTPDLINYILCGTKQQKSAEMTTDQGVIYHSKDTVVCLNPQGVIEMMNPSLSKTLGYSPEQLLGQSIENLFASEDKTTIMNQLNLMSHHQSSLTYEGHVTCLADDDSEIQCQITIMAIENSNQVITNFVVILKDESDLVKKQQAAEEAKKKSETLLYQILPRDIVIRINQGEKDISFTVPSASIIFIDIVKFSEYASTLTPQEIMGNLSLVFAGFDESVVKYPLLLKIKLIGDVYMCAGGLFTPEEPPNSHAEQMTKFGLEALQVIEDVNVKLNALLNVRIGINTGGPLIAGVLGTDKPTFDIIGDPINIASRLQSTDYPGKIQISQATYDLIKAGDFQIEPRGDVFLKGKGKQPAYLVSPVKTFSYVMSSSDL